MRQVTHITTGSYLNKRSEALEASIQHWKELRDGEDPFKMILGVDSCALCQKYFESKGCVGCPVYSRTGLDECRGTPFSKAHTAWKLWRLVLINKADDTLPREAFKAAADEEVKFLESLRPRSKPCR